jgi:hypothetical protein
MYENTVQDLLRPKDPSQLLLNSPEGWAEGCKALAAAHIVEVDDPTVLYTNRFVEAAAKT